MFNAYVVNLFIQQRFTVCYQRGTMYCFSLWRDCNKWDPQDPWTHGAYIPAREIGNGQGSKLKKIVWSAVSGINRVVLEREFGRNRYHYRVGWMQHVGWALRLRTSQQVHEGMKSILGRGNKKGNCCERTRQDHRIKKRRVGLAQKGWQSTQEWVISAKEWGTQKRTSWVMLRGLDCMTRGGGQQWRVLNKPVTCLANVFIF